MVMRNLGSIYEARGLDLSAIYEPIKRQKKKKE